MTDPATIDSVRGLVVEATALLDAALGDEQDNKSLVGREVHGKLRQAHDNFLALKLKEVHDTDETDELEELQRQFGVVVDRTLIELFNVDPEEVEANKTKDEG